MTQINQQEYQDFVYQQFSLNILNETQTNFLISQTDPSDILAGLESVGLRREFQSRKELDMKNQQEIDYQKCALLDQIKKLEEEIAIEDAKMNLIQKEMEPILTRYDNSFKRSQQYPDNPRIKEEVEKIAEELCVYRDQLEPYKKIIKAKQEVLSNLRCMEGLM